MQVCNNIIINASIQVMTCFYNQEFLSFFMIYRPCISINFVSAIRSGFVGQLEL